jgi:glycosyltransferase involved in cell wall biosynthesis
MRELASLKRIAILPALNEEESVGRVIEEIRAFDPGFAIVVVDDGSTDRTAAVAAAHGAKVLRLRFNLGIGGAVQTGYHYALENGFELAVQIDGDGQHDASQLGTLLAPLLADEADVVIGSRFANGGIYAAGRPRRLGIRLFAALASLLCRQRLTDTTSGFRAVNRRGICLFARDYPHDYPEVEAIVMAVRQKLRLREVPVSMRVRDSGHSSITTARALYYVVKVTLAMVVGLTRKNVVPLEDQ